MLSKRFSSLITFRNSLILLGLFFAVLFITNAEPYVRLDGFCYYHTAKSVLNTGSFVTTSQPEYWNYMGHVKETYRGKYISVCAPGAALINLPGLAVAQLFTRGQTIDNNYFIAYNGHTLAEGIAILTTAALCGLATYLLLYKALRNFGYSEKTSIASLWAMMLSSYVLWYVLLLPIYTHIYEVLTVSLLLYSLSINAKKHAAYLFGAATGLMILTRPVLLPIPVAALAYLLLRKPSIRSKLAALAKILIAGLPFALIYLLYNYVSYGSALATGYSSVRDETFSLSQFNLLPLLFAPEKGWFVFSPIYLFAVWGLWELRGKSGKDRYLGIIGLFSIFSIAAIYAFWPAWWGGGSFGSRFMLFALPFGAIGIAEFIKIYRQISLRFLVVAATAFSFTIFCLYRITPLGNTDLYTPLYFFGYQAKLIANAKSPFDYVKKVYNGIEEGSGLLALLTGISDYVMTIRPTDNCTYDVKLFKPPFGNPETPKTLDTFIAKNSILYTAVLTVDYEKPMKIYCDFATSPAVSDFRISELRLVSLPVADYAGVMFTENYMQVYLPRGKNIQFRGDLLTWPRGEDSFKLFHL